MTDTEQFEFRDAVPSEAGLLGDIAFRSKAYWGYDPSFMEACRTVLSFTPDEVAAGDFRLAVAGDLRAGFYQLGGEPSDGVIENFFVAPEWIGRGLGGLLWRDLIARARRAGMRRLVVDADPHAAGFYERGGMTRCGVAVSTAIPGRFLPRLSRTL
ncbi:GNAT family N-acetyltransferase [Oceanibacterium hippocampi]|uniref:Acetyltransferase (GNAT) family protein n=1 Tax=Oceanibacterium hippocampi TaxID=745714 RepID=A0A1Y5TUD3_9PROT|nr:GNAT family N-acetyltransferase [Oceanibacterium hippocampi]SLN73028.1 Acetyltransferase (GNAT) family protein [Oceanibacterium hippocampi]